MTQAITLYGMPASLYTAKARSYLIKNSIPFIERGIGAPEYATQIMPQIGRYIMPVIRTDNGLIVQDGADIIDHFEHSDTPVKYSAYPQSPLLKTVSHLFELFGGEGMLRPAMHYRWNFDDTNLEFIRNDFVAALADPKLSKQDKYPIFDKASSRMRAAAAAFGVTPESKDLIEQSYLEFLALFANHLQSVPFLLGGRPTIGDYGLIAPLFAHLGRDPYPSTLMKSKADEVFRWVERMNSSEQKIVEHTSDSEELITPSAIPDSLKALMRYVADEYLNEITAHVDTTNNWIDNHPNLITGTNGLEPGSSSGGLANKRWIGNASFEWRGIQLESIVMPYRFYILQRLQASFEQADQTEQSSIKSLFEETGLGSLLTLKTHRPVQRINHLEVWGEDIRK